MSTAPAHVDTRPRAGLLRMILLSPLWAVPFALFFGTLFGARWDTYRIAFGYAVVFSLSIRLALWATARYVIPAMRIPVSDHAWLPISLIHIAGALVGSFVAAFAIRSFQPDFIGDVRGALQLVLWSLLFSALFGGIIMAMRFREVALERRAQVERMRAELIRAELRALQAQINPHFLFNTLNSIAALIAENPAAAEDLTTRLADVFRYALTSTRHEHARLGDELDFVRTCLSIERVRFGERLRVHEAIEPGLGGVLVPALLLQPLVENAVRYAVADREAGGTITLGARSDGDALVLEVTDDGPGFAPGAPPRGHGVGLESVRERLRLAGEGHALELDTAPGRGTRVTVRVPVVTKAHDRNAAIATEVYP